jgi:hypothetical protein
MRVMVFGIATEDSERARPQRPRRSRRWTRFTEELVEAGVLVAGAGLKPTDQGKRILFDGPDRTLIDGPFAETKEADRRLFDLGGQGHGRGRGLGDAQPQSDVGPSKIEIRPFLEAADLAEFLTPDELATPREGRAREARRRLIRSAGSEAPLLDPVDVEQALREQPCAALLDEGVLVAKRRDHQRRPAASMVR